MKPLAALLYALFILTPMYAQEHNLPESLNKALGNKSKKILILPTQEENTVLQRKLNNYATNTQKQFAPDLEVIKDEDALNRDLSQYDIVAYGTIWGNLWIKKHWENSPIRITPRSVRGVNKNEGQNLRVITVLNIPRTSAVVYTGQTAKAIIGINSLYHGPTQYVIAKNSAILESAFFLKTEKGLICSATGIDLKRKYSLKEITSDMDYLFHKMERIHPKLYAYVPREKIEKLKKELLEGITEPITRKTFSQKLIPIVTQLKDGHTFVHIPGDEYDLFKNTGGLLFPLGISVREDRIYVSNNSNCPDIPLQSEILSINGDSGAWIIRSMQPYISGEKIFYRNVRIGRQFQELYWFLFGDLTVCDMEVRALGSSEVESVSTQGVSYKDYQNMVNKKYARYTPYSYYDLDNKIGVIDFKSFSNLNQFKGFLASAFKKIKDNRIQHLVIDIRQNGGGDSSLGDELFTYITDKPFCQAVRVDVKVCDETIKHGGLNRFDLTNLSEDSILTFENSPRKRGVKELRFKGDVYLLTSHISFSSANMFASTFKYYKMGKVIGQETGGACVSYGDIFRLKLPITKLDAGVSYKRFFEPGGEENLRGVIPDILVTPDPTGKTDPEMEMVKSLIQG